MTSFIVKIMFIIVKINIHSGLY